LNFAITKSHFSSTDIAKIDSRFLPYMDDWLVVETYKNEVVSIPNTWNSEIFPFNYYEVIKEPGDPNSSEAENEKELSLSCGWRGGDGMYDREVQINLRISGLDVLNGYDRISVELLKCGGAPMKVYFKEKFITDFYDHTYWWKNPNGYQTIKNLKHKVG